jgi:hypothetical protein
MTNLFIDLLDFSVLHFEDFFAVMIGTIIHSYDIHSIIEASAI